MESGDIFKHMVFMPCGLLCFLIVTHKIFKDIYKCQMLK